MQIKWQSPPSSGAGRKGADLTPIIDELKKKPGEWALVQEAVSANTKPWTSRGCVATTRRSTKDPKKVDIYVRWPAVPRGSSGVSVPEREAPAAREREAAAARRDQLLQQQQPKPAAGPSSLNLNDPNDAARLRQRQKFEAGRAARINRGRNA